MFQVKKKTFCTALGHDLSSAVARITKLAFEKVLYCREKKIKILWLFKGHVVCTEAPMNWLHHTTLELAEYY